MRTHKRNREGTDTHVYDKTQRRVVVVVVIILVVVVVVVFYLSFDDDVMMRPCRASLFWGKWSPRHKKKRGAIFFCLFFCLGFVI